MSEAPRPIVVGYDGSPDAELALGWAAKTAHVQAKPLEVVIVGSHMDPLVGHFREHNDRLVDECHRRAYDGLKEAGVASWEVEVRRGPTVPVLLAAAESADMLVVGSRGHGLLLGSLSGSVSQHVARHAPCPVVVVRPPRQAGARQIVVGIDGSSGSDAALLFACSRARDTAESVFALHGYRAPLAMEVDPFAPKRIERMESADRLTAESAARIRADYPDVDLMAQAIALSADRLLLDFSSTASLLVVGSRGRDAFAEMLLGSVAQHVLHRAECPVAVVR
jgi:nucleotide-binding universal stress UspA family protein